VATGSVGVLRRPLVLGLVAGACAVLGVLAWTVLRSSTDPTAGTAPSVLVRPGATQAPAPAAGSARTGDDDGVPLAGRNPFGDDGAIATTGPAIPPQVEPSPTPAASASPASTSTASTSMDGAGSGATVTVTVGPTYVGLYGWNGSRASFRVNARAYSVRVGAAFGPRLRFTAVVPGTPRCAKVQHGQDTFTLCPGQFTTLT
jgi:hypothetical protein